MWTAALLAIGIDGAAMPASDVFPGVGDFRLQKIHRAAGESEWPFVAESGTLLCAMILRQPAVYFVPEVGRTPGRAFAIDNDIAKMAFANIGMTGVLEPYDNFEQLLKRLIPYVTMGKRLCNQPPGTNVSGSEL
ncbi:hypothetical protein BMW22_24965 [Rhizobium leguminosarum]|uniref:Uncharacterized protein n=1 Tax=Rhizobium leguminosarum TaxID=384 RepID=A0A1L3ZFT4_RHILE|nr:hypothetical protein [Rhizobium leguminosarum]API54428.1 hypothetical protein BMW22_24965 [Rhizobium leguminosarum]NKL06293.1 hypothetical protein [Rhizobium leguminosarum bv. viciae]NKL83014.1 hypothetical protein [Rhizobium leguminosarum bv. viciae]NKL92155.1 hypothetical protein [Rhizobium leguminosarum bv. viciae]NKM92141.1 hypothetical protein [Rhizobium leguminosarum bv. viciae]